MYRTSTYILAIVAIGATLGAAQLPEELAANRCGRQGNGVACWRALANHNGCYFWAESFDTRTPFSWTGECSGGLAQGPGLLHWTAEPAPPSGGPARSMNQRGVLRDGKKHGDWVEGSFDGVHGALSEGPYVQGKKHGQWRHNFGGRIIHEGPYENDQRHGRWVERGGLRGLVEEGNYVFGQRQGLWTRRDRDGDEEESLYVDGERQGR